VSEPTVSVVLAVHDGWQDTLRTLHALLDGAAGVACETIVLDDASSDETRLALPHLAALVTARAEARAGVPRALAAGLELARGRHVLFLAQGAAPRPGFLAPLVAALDADPGLAAVSPLLVGPSGAVECAGLGVAYAAPLPVTPFPLDHGADAAQVAGGPAAALSGACLLVRAEALRAAGALDAAYAEAFWDVDLSFRLAAAGGRLAVVPASTVALCAPPDWSDLGRHADDLARLQRAWGGCFDGFTVDRRRSDAAPAARPGRAPISVVVPARDAVAAIAPLLEDVALNLSPEDEIVVADCGSQDGTAEYVEGFARRHPGRARLLRCDADAGLPAAARAGLRAASRPVAAVVHTAVSLAPGFLDDASALLARQEGPSALGVPMPGAGVYAAGPSALLRAAGESHPECFFAEHPAGLSAALAAQGAALVVLAPSA
jgi:GT2 family glycosyltransferase